MRYACILIYFCITWPVMGQDAKADFKKINEVYNKTTALSMDIKYELFLDGAVKAYEEEAGKYVKQQNKYFTRQGTSELVINDSHMFVIDKEEKVLAVDNRPDDHKIANPLSLSLDSLFVLYSKIEPLKGASADISGYRFYIKEGPYTMCEVLYNVKTNFVTEIRQVFRDKITDESDKAHTAVMKTTFFNVSDHVSDPGVFSDSRYVTKGSKQYILSDTYKSFTFINHLN